MSVWRVFWGYYFPQACSFFFKKNRLILKKCNSISFFFVLSLLTNRETKKKTEKHDKGAFIVFVFPTHISSVCKVYFNLPRKPKQPTHFVPVQWNNVCKPLKNKHVFEKEIFSGASFPQFLDAYQHQVNSKLNWGRCRYRLKWTGCSSNSSGEKIGPRNSE